MGPGVVFTNARYPLGDDVTDLLEGPPLLQASKDRGRCNTVTRRDNRQGIAGRSWLGSGARRS